MVEGIVKTINTKPAEPWLVVCHKDAGDVEEQVRRGLPSRDAAVHFLHWGAHDATNEFAGVPNIILAGTLFYRPAMYEALGRLAAGRPSSDGTFSAEDFKEVSRGEHRHLILQALCRGMVRRCNGAKCPAVDAYIIASNGSGIQRELPSIFPGCQIVRWQPVPMELKGKAGMAASFVIDRLAQGASKVPFRALQEHLEITDKANFNRTIRKHRAFLEALAQEGIIEWPLQRPVGFTREYEAYFGGTDLSLAA